MSKIPTNRFIKQDAGIVKWFVLNHCKCNVGDTQTQEFLEATRKSRETFKVSFVLDRRWQVVLFYVTWCIKLDTICLQGPLSHRFSSLETQSVASELKFFLSDRAACSDLVHPCTYTSTGERSSIPVLTWKSEIHNGCKVDLHDFLYIQPMLPLNATWILMDPCKLSWFTSWCIRTTCKTIRELGCV